MKTEAEQGDTDATSEDQLVKLLHRLKLCEEDATRDDRNHRQQRLVCGDTIADRAIGECLVEKPQLDGGTRAQPLSDSRPIPA